MRTRLLPVHRRGRIRAAVAVVVAGAAVAGPALGLDKQGSAHGGEVAGADSGVDVTGAASLGLAVYNPTYGARPNNSGLTLMRYALHTDFDLIGRRLSIPLDLNLFSDSTQRGVRKLSPSELDFITGVTTTRRLWIGALELGVRLEHDRYADQGAPGTTPAGVSPTLTQTYADVRARYLYSVADALPSVGEALHDGDISGWLTLGVFALNPTYAARPDNSGLALLRYAQHVELSVFHDYVALGVDTTFFTSRCAKSPVRPSELDLTPEVIGRVAPVELHVAYERDMPTDGGSAGDTCGVAPHPPGIVQSFAYLLFAYEFDLVANPPLPLESRAPIPSP